MTVVELERALDAEQDRKISATGIVELTLPESVNEGLREAMQLARECEGRWLTPGECLAIMSAHCIEEWMPQATVRLRRMGRIRRRDGGFCTTPGCSAPGSHAHHIDPRGSGGGDEDENLTSTCPGHHLHGIHLGFVRVEGKAPDGLTWWLGEKEVARSRGRGEVERQGAR